MTLECSSTGPINYLVFDLGKVLVDFSYRQFFPLLRKHGALIKGVDDFAQQIDLKAYEHGQLTTAEFLSRINGLLSAPLEQTELETAWCAIFSPAPQMLNLLRRLHGATKVFIISNTGEIHWQYLRQRFALDDLCQDAFASYEVGVMKPAAQIYQLAEQRFGLVPAETVFIDDRQQNVAAAITCGWQGIVHLSYGQTLATLKNLGLKIPD